MGDEPVPPRKSKARDGQLHPDDAIPQLPDGSYLIELDPHAIKPNPKQPRREFDEEKLLELADSIRRDGVHQPIRVREKNGDYELVSGERRLRATILAERDVIPAVCGQFSDDDLLRLGLIENVQREDLNPIELAHGYQALIKDFDWTQEELGRQLGKKRATVTNVLRLLNLPADVQAQVRTGNVSLGHAKALLAFKSPAKQSAVCRAIVHKGLSVRQVERMSEPKGPKTAAASPKDPHIAEIEDQLRRHYGSRVTIRTTPDHRGKIEIDYYNLDDFERIVRLLKS